jgi:uncharacterized membrane protein YedE/YeeE
VVEANVIGGLLGGAMIGVASVLMLLLIGRLAGVSGILGGAFIFTTIEDVPWRVAFIVGLILGAVFYRLFWGALVIELQAQGAILVVAGILVGLGTRVGSGCTSGHGVCGVARRSKRSITATLTFIGVAMLTVYFVRHVFS